MIWWRFNSISVIRYAGNFEILKVILYNYYGEELQSYCYRLTSVSSILTVHVSMNLLVVMKLHQNMYHKVL